MKKFLKVCATMSIMLLVALQPQVGEVYANESVAESQVLTPSEVKVTVTNNETGETQVLDSIDVKENVKVKSVRSIDESTEVGYEVFIPLTTEGATRTVTGGEQQSGGITATLKVNYDVNSTNEKVRLNKVYGSWVPSSSLYYLTDREVGAHSGTFTGKKLNKYPTSNSFSYTTGWGYNDRIWGDVSPRAWSSAISHVSGMSGTHTIKVEFTYS